MIGPPRCFEATLDLRIAVLTEALPPVSARFDIPFLPLFQRMPDASSREGAGSGDRNAPTGTAAIRTRAAMR